MPAGRNPAPRADAGSTPRKLFAVAGATTRYALLADSIIEDIGAGRYAVGSLLPTETELCEQFGVSRHTVREALRRLREMGLVSRHQGIGTRVKAAHGDARYVQSVDSISDLFTYIDKTRLAVVARCDLQVGLAQSLLLRCAPGQRWHMLEVLRVPEPGGLPMVTSEIYVPHAYAAISREMEDLRVPIYTLIEQRYGERIVEVQQVMRPCAIPAKKARLLKVRSGFPGMEIIRHYMAADDQMLLVSKSLYPAGRFSYSMSLRFAWQDTAAQAA